MKKQNIDKIYEETFDLIIELGIVSSSNGIHLDNNLEVGLFALFIDENYNEIVLL
jgi:hypothetical protein